MPNVCFLILYRLRSAVANFQTESLQEVLIPLTPLNTDTSGPTIRRFAFSRDYTISSYVAYHLQTYTCQHRNNNGKIIENFVLPHMGIGGTASTARHLNTSMLD